MTKARPGFPRPEGIALAGVLVIAVVVRLIGVGWGLPLVYHPDEPLFVGKVLEMMQTGDFNPRYFIYPSLFLYLLLPAAILTFAQGATKGQFSSVADLFAGRMMTTGTGTTEIPSLYLLGRLEMTLFGMLTIYLVYRLGREIADWRTGILAALLLSLSPIHIIASHYYRPDALVTLLVVASAYAAVRVFTTGSWAGYVAAGMLAGLAAASQYNGIVVLAVLWVAHLLRTRTLAHAGLWVGTAVAALGFLIGMPFALFDMPTWLDDLAWQLRHYYVVGHAGAEAEGPVSQTLWYLGKLVEYTGALPLLAVVGLVVDVIRRRWTSVIIATFPTVYFFLMIRPRVHTIMMLTPMLPFLALLGARGFLVLWARRPKHAVPRSVVAIGLLLALLLVPWLQTLSTVHMFARPEARTAAREWIVKNLPVGARIAMESYTPLLPDGFDVVYIAYKLTDHPPDWYVENQFDYLVASSATYGRFYVSANTYTRDKALYDKLFETFTLLAEIEGPFKFMADPKGVIRVYKVPTPGDTQ